MSAAFSRSMLSLDADHFKASLLGLFLAAALLVAWFLLTHVALCEISDTARLELDALGTVTQRGELKLVADFPAAALGRIQPGQAARLRLDGFPRSTVS